MSGPFISDNESDLVFTIEEAEQIEKHRDEVHSQQMRHADELHTQHMKHREDAHQHNIEHAKKHKKTLATVQLYGTGFAFNSPEDNDADDGPGEDETPTGSGGVV